MKLQNKKVLVTGADGFIGSHLAERLVGLGATVRAIAYYNSFNSWGWLDTMSAEVLNDMEVVTGDVRDPSFVRQAVKGNDVVFHLAALIAIPYSYQSPGSYVDTNIRGTLHVMEAARDLGVEKVIHTSTSEVYGSAQYVPINEDHPLQGQSPYSASKIGADQIALSFHLSFNTPVAVLRPFNTYGPRQSLRAVIPTIITQIASGKNKISLGALHPTRDFNYVEDTVTAFLDVAASDLTSGKVINSGSGREISIGDVAGEIARLMNSNIEIVCDKDRLRPEPSEVQRLRADNTRLKQLTGWSPRFTLETGLEKTIAWFTQPENLARYKVDIYNR
ncbi:MAG: NAD-dependent 4,6-dehydratase LegB [Acidobacteriia bacterium]|nr:NAD-dependent 4,6-dehydratase LegB [Terriglobia bacterium]